MTQAENRVKTPEDIKLNHFYRLYGGSGKSTLILVTVPPMRKRGGLWAETELTFIDWESPLKKPQRIAVVELGLVPREDQTYAEACLFHCPALRPLPVEQIRKYL